MIRKAFIPIVCAALVASVTVSCNREIEFGKSPVKKVVAAMTLEEKVNLLVGVGAWNGNDIAQEIKDAKNLIPGCAGQTYPIPRLGIPSVMLPDGPGDLGPDGRCHVAAVNITDLNGFNRICFTRFRYVTEELFCFQSRSQTVFIQYGGNCPAGCQQKYFWFSFHD